MADDKALALPRAILTIEAQIHARPSSARLREDLLVAYDEHPALQAAPGRIAQILWLITHAPHRHSARSPLMYIDAVEHPDAFAMVAQRWSERHARDPADPHIVCGYASFLACGDPVRALRLLQEFVAGDPSHADVWLQLGQQAEAAEMRLSYLLEARRRGAEHPNLMVWIARTAFEAGDLTLAESTAKEMLASVVPTQPATTSLPALFRKPVRSALGTAIGAALSPPTGQLAYQKHWGHTILGLVALRRHADTEARAHLREAANVGDDPRLSSYGPSLQLARELALRGAVDEVRAYLDACEKFCEDAVIPEWRAALAMGRVPEVEPDA